MELLYQVTPTLNHVTGDSIPAMINKIIQYIYNKAIN